MVIGLVAVGTRVVERLLVLQGRSQLAAVVLVAEQGSHQGHCNTQTHTQLLQANSQHSRQVPVMLSLEPRGQNFGLEARGLTSLVPVGCAEN